MNKKHSLLRCRVAMYAFAMSMFSLPACQKVIDIDLNSASPQIVIEAAISDGSESAAVRVSRTVNFDEPNVFPPVVGALVTLSDNAGNTEALTETLPGYYSASTMAGIPGRIYTLTVNIGSEKYVARSTMPPVVEIDSLEVEKDPIHGEKIISVHFKDPIGISNYYRFVEILNGLQQEFIFLIDDRLRDGTTVTSTLLAQDNKLKSGDSVSVRLESIDEGTFEYFRTAAQISSQGRGQTASPANPRTNLSNGALGYFSAYSARSRAIVIP